MSDKSDTPRTDALQEQLAAMDGPECLYTEEMADRMWLLMRDLEEKLTYLFANAVGDSMALGIMGLQRRELAAANALLAKNEGRVKAIVDAELLQRAEKAEAERDALRRFVEDMFRESDWPNGGDIDGFAFQDAAIAASLLVGETRTEPCGDNCHCAEYHGDMSEGVTCYRKPTWLIDAARAK